MRYLLIITLIYINLFASLDTKVCKKCHGLIYEEFKKSMHKHSSITDDEVHNAVWNLHPLKKKNNYTCAKCHATKDSKLGLNCLSCHKITNIQKHEKTDTNIYTKDSKLLFSAQKGMEQSVVKYHKTSSLFGLLKKSVGSPYHDIDYTHKEFYNGNICMGCHSHKQNEQKFMVCQTDSNNSLKQNCITCHMPQVLGSATSIRASKTHAYHGFSGVYNNPQMLSKYIEIKLKNAKNSFIISIKNQAPHNLLTHPLRVVILKVAIKRGANIINLAPKNFVKVIGKNGKPTMPWLAKQIVKNNMIKGNETQEITFATPIKKGDQIIATLGYYIVNPKAIAKLGIKNNNIKEFKVLKVQNFSN